MESFSPISAAFARSFMRRQWSETMRGWYDHLIMDSNNDIESAAKRGCTGIVFGLTKEPLETVQLVAEEFRALGFTVVRSEDYNELKIDWVQE